MKFQEYEGSNSGDNAEVYRNYLMLELLKEAPMLNFLECYAIAGNADKPIKAAKLEGGRVRKLNQDYEAKKAEVSLGDVSLKIVGDEIKMDKAYERRFSKATGSEWTRQIKAFAKSYGRLLQDELINGKGGDDDVSGLKALTPAGNKHKFHGANGGQLLAGNTTEAIESRAEFTEQVDSIIYSMGGCDFIVASSRLISRMKGIATSSTYYTNVNDMYGQTIQIAYWNGITPIIPLGYKGVDLDSGLIIPNNEVCGTTKNSTSIYFAKTGEGTDLTVATNVGLCFDYKGLVGNFYTASVEIDIDQTLVNDDALACLSGIVLDETIQTIQAV